MTNSYPGGIRPIDEEDEDSGVEARIDRANGGEIAIPYDNVAFVDHRGGPDAAFDAVNELLEKAALPIRVAQIDDRSDTHIIFLEDGREKPYVSATDLLREALEWVTDKPWDDSSLLHKRISEFIGTPVQYPEYIAKLKEDQSDD
jgi:hypothetical protein